MRNMFMRAGLSFGWVKPTGMHVLWSTPQAKTRMLRHDYEIATQIAGALLFRAMDCPMVLVTDQAGYREVQHLGTAHLYDDIRIESELVDPRIHPHVFWAAGKIAAYELVKAPFVCMDFDAYVLKPFWRMAGDSLVYANKEPLEWECYRHNEQDYGAYIPEFVDWRINPCNVSVLGMFDDRLRLGYTALANRFMRQYSEDMERGKVKPKAMHDEELPGAFKFFCEQVFAEQRILAMMLSFGYSSRPLSGLNEAQDSVLPNPFFRHLWRHKALLSKSADARKAYIGSLVDLLRDRADSDAGPFVDKVHSMLLAY